MSLERQVSKEQKPFDFEDSFGLLANSLRFELKRTREAWIKIGLGGPTRGVFLSKTGVIYGDFNGTIFVPTQTPNSILGLFALAKNPEPFLEGVKGKSKEDRNRQIMMAATLYSINNIRLQKNIISTMENSLDILKAIAREQRSKPTLSRSLK